jgi:hypothetical protein
MGLSTTIALHTQAMVATAVHASDLPRTPFFCGLGAMELWKQRRFVLAMTVAEALEPEDGKLYPPQTSA